VRRNALSDFVNVNVTGKMAMKFEGDDADDRLIAVAICGPDHDVLLATRNGRSIRFPANDVRVFTGRSSVGVRGVKLAAGDAVISLSILRHEEVDTPVRAAYLRLASQRRRGAGEEGDAAEAAEPEEGEENGTAEASISEEQFADLASREEFLLSVTEKGFGVRSSAYDYRITGRSGQGIENMNLARRKDAVVAAFPVGARDQIIVITNTGMVMRMPVEGVSIKRRRSQGVVVFKVGEGERVVSVAHLAEAGENGAGDEDEGETAAPEAPP
jgi:DNA gyrase subunit A